MPNWKKVIVSGSDASLNSLSVATNVVAQSFTGSLFGTASFAVSASQAISSSYITGSNVFGPYGSNSVISASFAQTASYAKNIEISGAISNVDYIDFDISASVVSQTGRLFYDSGEGTLILGLAGGNVDLKVGEDLVEAIYNATGAPLTKGQVVYISGSQGNKVAIKLASSVGEQGSANTLGFVAEPIAAGAEGWIQTEGTLRGLNTNGLIAGQLIFLGTTPGTYTQTPPVAPNHGVRLGYAERIDTTVGSIYIKIDNGYELGELHDVLDNSTTSSYGDLLIRSGSVWTNSKQLTGSYGLTGSLTFINGGITGSLQGTSSFAVQSITSSYADSFTVNNNAVISGSLTILQNLTVFGSASITYVSESTLNIGTNLITVNSNTPAVRFGGLAVIDSGSSPQVSGSWLFDSIQNRWIFLHQQTVGSALTSSIGVMGPETYNNIGNETQITLNRLTKGYSGASGEHIGDSQISDDGTTVSIPGNLTITGSIKGNLTISGSTTITGSLGVGTTGSAVVGRIDAANDVVAFATSDQNLKKNIKPIKNAIEKIEQIGGYTFDWKKDKNNIHGFSGHDIGVIAQEVEKVLPEVVITRDNGYKAVRYEKIVPLLIQCIKELKDEIRELKSQK